MVALAGRTLVKCEAVADELTAIGARALPLVCDVSVRSQVEQAMVALASNDLTYMSGQTLMLTGGA